MGTTATLRKQYHEDFRDAKPANPGAISLLLTAPLNRATGDALWATLKGEEEEEKKKKE